MPDGMRGVYRLTKTKPLLRRVVRIGATFLLLVSAVPIITFVAFGRDEQQNYALRSEGRAARGQVIAVQRIIGGAPTSFTVAFDASGRQVVATDDRSRFPDALRDVKVGDMVALTYLPSDPRVVLVGELLPLEGRADTARDMIWPVIFAVSSGAVLWATRRRGPRGAAHGQQPSPSVKRGAEADG